MPFWIPRCRRPTASHFAPRGGEKTRVRVATQGIPITWPDDGRLLMEQLSKSESPEVNLQNPGRKAEATFRDGEKLAGTMEAYNPRKYGFLARPRGSRVKQSAGLGHHQEKAMQIRRIGFSCSSSPAFPSFSQVPMRYKLPMAMIQGFTLQENRVYPWL